MFLIWSYEYLVSLEPNCPKFGHVILFLWDDLLEIFCSTRWRFAVDQRFVKRQVVWVAEGVYLLYLGVQILEQWEHSRPYLNKGPYELSATIHCMALSLKVENSLLQCLGAGQKVYLWKLDNKIVASWIACHAGHVLVMMCFGILLKVLTQHSQTQCYTSYLFGSFFFKVTK